MGARTNYTIVTTDNREQNINIYSHWDGDESVALLQNALAKATTRLGDSSYFVRILIDQLTLAGRDEETGYGIYIGEDINHEEQYEYKEINLLKNTITVGQITMTFDDFAKVMV